MYIKIVIFAGFIFGSFYYNSRIKMFLLKICGYITLKAGYSCSTPTILMRKFFLSLHKFFLL